MNLVYSFIIFCYQLLLDALALWHPKAKQLVKGRKETFKQLQNLPKTTNKRYWFHCASLGEYDMALPLIETCLAYDPSLEIIVSFYSPSGMLHYHKRGFVPKYVFYLPSDLPAKMRRLIHLVSADRLYLLKYEFWPNLLRAAQAANLDIYSVSTLLRPSQVYLKWYGGFFRNALRRVTYFGVQNETTQNLLYTLGIAPQKIEILGDLRINRVVAARTNAKKNGIIEQFSKGGQLLILGSSWPQEEDLLLKVRSLFNAKILIAPHDLSTTHLQQLKLKFPMALFYTELQEGEIPEAEILILDTIGHLSAAYQYGSVAFIGGGFSGSLHNILEPAAYGLPLVFGPKHQKFPEAQLFLDLGFAKEIKSSESLLAALQNFLKDNLQLRATIEAQVFKMQVKVPSKLVN
jgi:3-deoxy-D-manno-octulosonic-acid transferase